MAETALALVALALGLYALPRDGGAPVLQLAWAFQWSQVAGAVLYSQITGRQLDELQRADYAGPMAIALAALLALALGLRVGVGPAPATEASSPEREHSLPGSRTLAPFYLAATVGFGLVNRAASSMPAVQQIILSVAFLRYALLFLLLRRAVRPLRLRWLFFIISFEVLVGLTGFFADFREVLMLAALALLEVMDRRRARDWGVLVGLAVATVVLGAMWTGIKERYRFDYGRGEYAESATARLGRVRTLAGEWWGRDLEAHARDVDQLFVRLWAMPVQARAFMRVPSVVPHEDGALLGDAVAHVLMPRVLFREKKTLLDADTNMVRRYSGMKVAGSERGTSIAFGYVAESYVDFGLPGMFIPIFVYGLLMGLAYRQLRRRIRNRELAVSVITPLFWSTLYLYERSWAKMLGASLSLLLVVGGAALAADRVRRWWLARRGAAA